MKLHIGSDELYPFCILDVGGATEDSHDVPDEVVERYRQACKEMFLVQQEIADIDGWGHRCGDWLELIEETLTGRVDDVPWPEWIAEQRAGWPTPEPGRFALPPPPTEPLPRARPMPAPEHPAPPVVENDPDGWLWGKIRGEE